LDTAGQSSTPIHSLDHRKDGNVVKENDDLMAATAMV
jgi:hypothetical protein